MDTSTLNRAGFYLPFSGAAVSCDRETYQAMSRDYGYIPLFVQKEIPNFNIVEFYQKLNPIPPACLLESLSGTDNGRYSIVAVKPLQILTSTLNDPQGSGMLRAFMSGATYPKLNFPFYCGGPIGFWSYEEALGFHQLPHRSGSFTEQFFFVPGEVIVYDRHQHQITIIIWSKTSTAAEFNFRCACRRLDDLLLEAQTCQGESLRHISASAQEGLDKEFAVNISREEYCSRVLRAKEHIRQGDIFQVVLSRRWQKESAADPWQVYLKLRAINPSPYMFYFQLPDAVLMGASPEMQVKVAKGIIKTRPIAGTRKITGDPATDHDLARELLQDNKERAEHLMLVDLSRNDVGRVSKAGSVQVSDFMILEKYSHVVHIVSTVEGELKEDVDSLEAFQACFPAGTLSGAPKRKAMEIISELEEDPRGPYGGAAGFVSFNGLLDSCITIRSILYRGGKYYLQSGAGIVADSVPEKEHEETLHKARVLMLAIKEAEKARDFDDR